VISFLFFIGLSAFFSGSETALFSLTHIDLARLREQDTPSARRVIRLLQNPSRLLITILTGNTLVNICAATIATLFTARLSHDFGFSERWGIFIEVIVVTFILLVFAEITPKVLAVKNAMRFAPRVSLVLDLLSGFFYPVSFALNRLTQLLSKKLVFGKKKFLSEEEIKALIEIGEEKGTIREQERVMIDSIFQFGEKTVREIMVPRVDMVCVSTKATLEEVAELVREKGFSRFPLYEEQVDNIKGIIHVKDLIPFLNRQKTGRIDLIKLARPAYFVPESRKIDELLRDFQRNKIHMAVVVDEYGGTSGLVTLEDVIEEIVGEIQDEYDQEAPLYSRIDSHTYLVDARIDLHELNEILEETLPIEGDYETLGGFIYNLTASIPKEGDVIHFKNYEFHVEKLEGQRISKVRILYKKPKSSE